MQLSNKSTFLLSALCKMTECYNLRKYRHFTVTTETNVVEICTTYHSSFSFVIGGNSHFMNCVMLEESISFIRTIALINMEL